MTSQEIYSALAPIVEQVLQIPKFDETTSMYTAPMWDSLKHVQLLSAIEKKFDIEISADEAFKLTSAERLVRYLQGAIDKGTRS